MCVCNRYIAFSLNFIYFILGGVVVGLGIWVLIDLPHFAKFFGYGTLVGGGVLILSSCLGFLGNTNTTKSLLVLYAISLVVVIALKSYVIYRCFTLNSTNVEEVVYQGLDKSFKTGEIKIYHNLEKTIKCCGVNQSEGGDYPNGRLPKLCCMEDPQGKMCKPNLKSSIGEEFRNRKSLFSLNVQAVCDANLMFMNVVARWPGSTHDATIFNNSELRVWPSCTKVVTEHVVEYARPFAYGMMGSCVVQVLMILSACILITTHDSH